MARALSHLCDLMNFSPFSLGHFELLQHDNVPGENLLPALLGRSPRTVGFSSAAGDGWGPETATGASAAT
jgi:hypothetical protein